MKPVTVSFKLYFLFKFYSKVLFVLLFFPLDTYFQCLICDLVFKDKVFYRIHAKACNSKFICQTVDLSESYPSNSKYDNGEEDHVVKPEILEKDGNVVEYRQVGKRRIRRLPEYLDEEFMKTENNNDLDMPNHEIKVEYPERKDKQRVYIPFIKSSVEDRPYHCDVCGCSFAQIANLNKHMKKHRYKCRICSAKFGTSFNLNRHIRSHTGEKPYKCQVCQASFITNGHLSTHMRRHTGVKPYKCKYCGKAFTQSGNLSSHLRGHTGDKPFRCNFCTYRSVSSSDLTRHVRIHTGEKPYQCEICDYRCATSGNLSCHMKRHTGEKPYKCTKCDFKSISSSNLKKHLERHEEMEKQDSNVGKILIYDHAVVDGRMVVINKELALDGES